MTRIINNNLIIKLIYKLFACDNASDNASPSSIYDSNLLISMVFYTVLAYTGWPVRYPSAIQLTVDHNFLIMNTIIYL